MKVLLVVNGEETEIDNIEVFEMAKGKYKDYDLLVMLDSGQEEKKEERLVEVSVSKPSEKGILEGVGGDSYPLIVCIEPKILEEKRALKKIIVVEKKDIHKYKLSTSYSLSTPRMKPADYRTLFW